MSWLPPDPVGDEKVPCPRCGSLQRFGVQHVSRSIKRMACSKCRYNVVWDAKIDQKPRIANIQRYDSL